MNDKYKLLINDSIKIKGVKLFRIKAKKSFSNIKEGDLGGYIEKEENLSVYGSAWVSGSAQVYGSALVYDSAQVSDSAQVYGSAWVSGSAQVYDFAQVYGSAKVYDSAQVYGSARVSDSALVYDSAQVSGSAQVYGSTQVYDSAQVYVSAKVYDSAQVYGSARVSEITTKTPIVITGLIYNITITDNKLRAGCKVFTFEEWKSKTLDEIKSMDGQTAIDFYPKLLEIINLFT